MFKQPLCLVLSATGPKPDGETGRQSPKLLDSFTGDSYGVWGADKAPKVSLSAWGGEKRLYVCHRYHCSDSNYGMVVKKAIAKDVHRYAI